MEIIVITGDIWLRGKITSNTEETEGFECGLMNPSIPHIWATSPQALKMGLSSCDNDVFCTYYIAGS